MLRFRGGVVGIAILVAVFAGIGGVGSAQDFSDGFAAAIGFAAGLSLAGALAGMGLPGRPEIDALAPSTISAAGLEKSA